MAVSWRNVLVAGIAFAAVIAFALVAPAPGSTGPAERCFTAKAAKRKTSLGVHQWTIRQEVRWCAELRSGRWHLVSVGRRASFRTGTNWRLISRGGGIRHEGGRAIAASRFHFRLRYPHFQQNCYPRIEIAIRATGRFERSVRTGC